MWGILAPLEFLCGTVASARHCDYFRMSTQHMTRDERMVYKIAMHAIWQMTLSSSLQEVTWLQCEYGSRNSICLFYFFKL